MQKRVSSQTTCVPSGIIWAAVATHGVAPGVAEVGIINAELRVIEKVEDLGAKFKIAGFGYFEVLLGCYIKVQATGVVHVIAPRISEGKSHGSHKCSGISKSRANALRIVSPNRRSCMGVTNDIWVRSGGSSVGHSSIVKN